MAFVTYTLAREGLIHADHFTAGADSMESWTGNPELHGDELVWKSAEESADIDMLRPASDPFQADGGLRLVQGNLGRAVFKTSAVEEERWLIEAPARCFSEQNEVLEAFKAGELDKDVVVVVRFQGPRANGMPELHKLTPTLGVLQDRGFKIALVTDGRMSGASGKVPAAIHVSPEALPDGPLRSLLVEGIVAGVGGVLVFLPQILFLFLFILALEESGYLPRAAYLLDKLMVGAGLTGRSFIPLLSGFACAIPGIMATRTIQDERDRLITILVTPLMTCSARLPVYALLIGAFIPKQTVFGIFNLQGVVLFTLYFAGVISALLVAWVMKYLRRDRTEHALLLELPSYRVPHPRDIAIGLWERASIFVRRVGTIILALTVLLWFLSSYPAAPADAVGPAIDYSFAGRLGHALEPIFAPLGFNWQICIALIPGMAAREVAVSAMATVYALSAASEDAAAQLAPIIASQWSLATALSLLAWYVFAPQCLSTLAVIRRETASWRTMALAAAYLFALAYAAAFLTYQIASRW